ncbi:MAG: hypothetical protein DHS20C15_27030 [Planctomycetota bacterium]|nr:MAG: hypothetical protein DHS20C15_27030 [Planctomycetota bacterium]
MGDHLHKEGELMLSFRAMRMQMAGMRDGTDNLSRADVFAAGFPVTPTRMTTDMLMLGAMYAPSDDVTLMVMLPHITKVMDHQTAGGVEFDTRSRGIGDVTVNSLIRAWDDGEHHLHWNLGLSLPTGSVKEQDDTPASGTNNVRLPYPMQLGTGTYDALVGATYTGASPEISWGSQVSLRIPLENKNNEGWRRGHREEFTSWIARPINEEHSVSARVRFAQWDRIHGADPLLNPNMVPTANPSLSEGERLDFLVGWNWFDADAGTEGNRLAFEFGAPVYQDLEGPQLETDFTVTAGWQKVF